jgi:hypothetical protein
VSGTAPLHRQAEWQALARIQGPEAWEGLVAGEGAGSGVWPRPPRAVPSTKEVQLNALIWSTGSKHPPCKMQSCKPTVMTAHAPQFANRTTSRPRPHCCMSSTCICGVCVRMHPGVGPKVTWGGQQQCAAIIMSQDSCGCFEIRRVPLPPYQVHLRPPPTEGVCGHRVLAFLGPGPASRSCLCSCSLCRLVCLCLSQLWPAPTVCEAAGQWMYSARP